MRRSNFELLRTLSMLLIVLVHTNYFLFGGVRAEEIILNPIGAFGRMLYEQICIVGVNVFVLISGYFGIRPKGQKFCNLIFQIIFWAGLSTLVGLLSGAEVPWKAVAKTFWLGGYYWFIPSYIALFAFSPVLNKFIENSSRRELMTMVCSFFAIEFFYGWLGNMGSYLNGYSFASFLGLYLLGRYVNLYSGRLCELNRRVYLLAYFLLSLLPAAVSFFTIWKFDKDFSTISYSSPFVVFAALSLLLYFSKLDFTNKAINWVASSVFAIYLFHLHPSIVPLFKRLFLFLNEKGPFVLYIVYSIIVAVVGGFLIVCVDKLRLWIWNKCVYVFMSRKNRLKIQ